MDNALVRAALLALVLLGAVPAAAQIPVAAPILQKGLGSVEPASTYTFSKYTYVAETDSTFISSITSPSITLGSGDFVMVYCRADSGSSAATITISSSPANSISTLASQFTANIATAELGYVLGAGSGATTFTCGVSPSAPFQSMIVLDYTHTGPAAALDQSNGSANGSNATSWTSPSFSTSANVLEIACATSYGGETYTAGTIGGVSATLRGVSGSSLTGTADSGCEEVKFTPAQTSITASINASGSHPWVGTEASFK